MFEHQRLLVEEDEIELPSGEKIAYIKYGYRGNGVVVICKNRESKYLFLKEYAYILEREITQLPMGLIKEGEAPEIAANRELAEETGLRAQSLKFLGTFWQSYRRSQNRAYVFLGIDLEPHNEEKDKEESMSVVWLTAEEIKAAIQKGEITDSDTLSSLQFLESNT